MFATLKADLLAFEEACSAENIPDIMKTSAKILNDAAGILGTFAATQDEEEDKKACMESCKRIDRMARSTPNQPKSSVKGIFPGDGSLLKALFQLILALMPLFVTPTPTPAPTE